MCSLHARIARQFNTVFSTVRDQLTGEVSDDTMFRLKQTKQKATDEFLLLTGCASSEKFLKLLQAPTPAKKNLPMLQTHVDELIKIVR